LLFRTTSNTTGICDYPRNVQCTGDGVRPPDDMINISTSATPVTTDSSPTEDTKPPNTTYHPRSLR